MQNKHAYFWFVASICAAQLGIFFVNQEQGFTGVDFVSLGWFNLWIGLTFLVALWMKLRTITSTVSGVLLSGVYLSFAIKLLGLLVVVGFFYLKIGKQSLVELRFFILGLFLFYTIVEFCLVSIRKK